MSTTQKFSCSVLVKNLGSAYGSQQSRENISLRESDDVTKFLKAKKESEEESRLSKMAFK